MGGMWSLKNLITFGHGRIRNQHPNCTPYYLRKPSIYSVSSWLIAVYLHKLRSRSQRLLPSTPVQLAAFPGNPRHRMEVVGLYTINSGWEPEIGIDRRGVYQVAVPDRKWWRTLEHELSFTQTSRDSSTLRNARISVKYVIHSTPTMQCQCFYLQFIIVVHIRPTSSFAGKIERSRMITLFNRVLVFVVLTHGESDIDLSGSTFLRILSSQGVR